MIRTMVRVVDNHMEINLQHEKGSMAYSGADGC